MMKGIFLTVLAFFVASCQMKKYLIEAESAEDADYEITTKHHLGDQKCRIWKERTLKEKCTPGEMYRKWCPEFKKQVADECGESSDYKDSKPKGLKCKKIGDIIKRHCSTPYERKKNKCGGHERSFKKYCGAGGSDYQDSKPKSPNQIPKPKGFCKNAEKTVSLLCSKPEEREKRKCDILWKFLRKECGGGAEWSDYKDSKPKGFCKDGREMISSICSKPEERERLKCDNLEKSLKKECGAGSSDYQDSKPKGFCKNGKEIVTMLCSKPEERERHKCDDLEKSLKKECGAGGSDYCLSGKHCPEHG